MSRRKRIPRSATAHHRARHKGTATKKLGKSRGKRTKRKK